MRDPDRVYDLGCRLAALAQSAGATSAVNKLNYTAQGILDNPQVHIDALVDAGVLTVCGTEAATGKAFLYVAPRPHVHDWRIDQMRPFHAGGVELVCGGCTDTRIVPNRLPIEIPTD